MNHNSIFHKMRAYTMRHKILSGIAAVIIVWGAYKGVQAFTGKSASFQYAIAAVQRGTIVATVTGTGQVSASNQVDLKSKASGNLVSLKVAVGQEVKTGQIIAQVDSRSADISLQNAKISLAKLTQPADASTMLQSENSLESSKQAYVDAQANLAKYYADALNEVASTLVDIPDVMDGLNNMFYSTTGFLSDNKTLFMSGSIVSDRIKAGAQYDISKKAYNDLLPVYRNVTRYSATSTIESLIEDTYDMTVKISEGLKNAKNIVDYIKSNQLQQSSSEATTAQTNVNNWTSKVTGHLSSLQAIKSEIANAKTTIISSANDIKQKQAALDKLKAGPDVLDVQSQQLSLRQQEYNYEDYFIRAPFDGVIAKLDVKKTDSVSSGTVVGTLISKNQIAEMSLNEVDASKVSVGQKVTLTFDAIEGLSITGHVAEVDLLGTVTQGVVTYDIKISFDTQDDRVKPGMTANASIQTAVKADVLVVPNSAIKTSNGVSTVGVVDGSTVITSGSQTIILPVAPSQQTVTVGISDDLNTEIISGLNEGDKIVSKTSNKTTTASASAAPSLFGTGGNRATGSGRAVTP